MKKLLVTLSMLIFIAFTVPCFAQQQMLGVLTRKNVAGGYVADTVFNDATEDHLWSTAGNWSAGKPTSADTCGVSSTVTSMNIDEAAACLEFVPTGTSGITISGTGALSVYGNFTLDASVTWTNTGILSFYTNPSIVTTAGVSLASVASFHIREASDVTLGSALNTGTKAIYVYGAGSSLATANYQVDCGILGDNATAGAITLTFGSSTINVTPKVIFQTATLTVTSSTSTVNITSTGTDIGYFGGTTWDGTVNILAVNSSIASIYDAAPNTFGNLGIVFNGSTNISKAQQVLMLRNGGSVTVTGTLTITGNLLTDTTLIIGRIAPQNPYTSTTTITAGSVSATGYFEMQGIIGAGAASWDLSGVGAGNTGGNTGITFRTPATYYLVCGTNDIRQDYHMVYSATDDGEARTAGANTVFPLPQDTLIIDDYTWDDTGNFFGFHSGGAYTGRIDASALTEAQTITLPRQIVGDVNYNSAAITIPAGYHVANIDSGLENEGGSTLDINILPSAANTNIPIKSISGTTRLVGNGLTTTGTVTLTQGVLDLNGQTLSVGILSSSGAVARTLQDTPTGGKIVLNGLTGTLFDTTTATNLTIDDAPDIDIGDSNNTLTGNVTFIGSGKTFGDFTVKKHAGDYDAILTGSNTFGVFTLETPDATYQFSDVQFEAATTTTVSSFVADGTSSYQININSSSAAAHSLSDAAGTDTVTYCTITYSQAGGGATWTPSTGCIDGGNNTGWGF